MTVRLIVFTLAALSLVNAYSFARIYSATYVTSDRAIVSNGKPTRLPAAIAPVAPVAVPEFKTRLAVDLNCKLNKKMTGHKVIGQWAQLKGRMCGSSKLKLVEITNLSNGFTASVFNVGTENYQTDLIQLNPGSNEIRVRLTPVKGEVEEKIINVESSTTSL